MKNARKLLALALTLVMTLALSVSALAAGSYTITIKNETAGHTYEAYQIFKGDLSSKDGSAVLSNIVWGSGVTEAGKTALRTFNGTTYDSAAALAAALTDTNVKDFAKAAAGYLATAADTSEWNASAKKYTISGLEAGYYLVKDTSAPADDFYSAYIMEVVQNVDVTPKGNKPTLDKQVKGDSNWGKGTGKQIGDTVEFRTVSTVPGTEGYTSYTYIITDTMSEGLTSNVTSANDVTIKVNDSAVLDAAYYTVAATGNTFTVTIDIFKAIQDGKMAAGNSLYTYYTGVLNERAAIDGSLQSPQKNTASLTYSNDPNNTENKGKTPDVEVKVHTFEIKVNKVDKDNAPLTGAKFVLSKNGSLTLDALSCDENGVPQNTSGLIGLVGTVENSYRVATPEDIASNPDKIVYAMEAGNIHIMGLDNAVDYYLYETKSPAGYNLLSAPVHFTVNATFDASGNCTVTGLTVDGSTVADGIINVVNKAGSTLPSTGGIGTRIFYLLGGLLVVCAGVLLVTRKRMGKDED